MPTTSAAASAAPSASTSADAAPPEPDPIPLSDAVAQTEKSCEVTEGSGILASPKRPHAARPLRWMGVSDAEIPAARLAVVGPDGKAEELSADSRGGPPHWLSGTQSAPAPGTHRAVLYGADGVVACQTIEVVRDVPKAAVFKSGSAWPVREAWDRRYENFFSAWVEMLFDAPLDEQPTWPALHDATRDESKNFLFDYLGAGEDRDFPKGLKLDPDCADLPYFLRAYFAYKMGLPFAYSSCTRGGGGKPPICQRRRDNLGAPKTGSDDPIKQFGNWLRVDLKDTVHSGTGRTPADEDNTDYYPVPLSQEHLRPGTIYADPYGHLLVVVRRVPQQKDAAGILFAVDGQPDGTVSRRRYWEGNFLFSTEYPELGSPGFKRMRPVVFEGGAVRPLTNDEIAASPIYGDFSLEQATMNAETFYDAMDGVLSPDPLEPKRAFLERIQALDEQITRRVLSVQNGEDFLEGGGGRIDMPEGPSIFETTGAWENYSTPSRDLRLLIAMDVVLSFPKKVKRNPGRFAMPAGQSADDVMAELERFLDEEAKKRTFTYERSDGTEQTLSMKDVLDRITEMEMAYNPNDCPELRWAAPEGSDERSSCNRNAPADQRAKMREYRPWFAERRRPVRR